MIKKILNLIIILLFIAWVYIIISDYLRFKNQEKVNFCIKNTVYDYEDGSTSECIGLCYKIYYYNRTSLNIKSEFGPFWIKMKD